MAFTPSYPTYFPGAQNFGMPQQMPVQQQAQASPGQGISALSRLVSNREEANATPADFSGALMVFPDVRNNRIYVKRWNNQTGGVDFLEFSPDIPDVGTSTPAPQYATKEDIDTLRTEIEALKRPSGKAVKKNDPDE